MNLVLLTKAMCLSGKIRYKMPSRSGSYYSSIQRQSRPAVVYSSTHFKFILFCFAFVTTNDMREDLFWEWVRQAHCFSPEQKDGILALRNPQTENCRSIGFLTLTRNAYLRNAVLQALERHGANNIGQFLNNTLEWARTSQGHGFWCDLNHRFDHCWTCISRAVMRPVRPDLTINELRTAIRTNISAGLLRQNDLTNPFFLSYEEDLRQYEERQVQRERELARQWESELRSVPGDRSSEERAEATEAEGHSDESGDNGQDGVAYTGQNGEVHFVTQEEYQRIRAAMEMNRARATPSYDTLPDGSIIVRFSDGSAMRMANGVTVEQPVTGEGLMGQTGTQGTTPVGATAANTATSVPGRESTTGQASRHFHFSYVDPFADLMWPGGSGTNNH